MGGGTSLEYQTYTSAHPFDTIVAGLARTTQLFGESDKWTTSTLFCPAACLHQEMTLTIVKNRFPRLAFVVFLRSISIVYFFYHFELLCMSITQEKRVRPP